MKNVAREATNGVIYGESGEIVKMACVLFVPIAEKSDFTPATAEV